jgi:predicted TIM-barrel fold metal-dependent hydrolase
MHGILRGMKTITLEEHFSTTTLLKATGAYGGANLQGPMADLQPKLLDVGLGRIAAMDEAGIDMQVLSPAAIGFDALDPETATAVAADVNDELAEAIAAHPDRFSGFAFLGMKEPAKAALELERCITKLGFLGAMINGAIGGAFLDSPEFLPVLESAVRLNVPIYLHPAPPPEPVRKAYYSDLSKAGWGWHADTGLHTLRLICAGVFDRLPDLQLIIGHMGEGLPYAMARSSGILSGPARLRRPVAEYFQTNIAVTTSGYFTLPPLQCALDVIGLDRLMFSVDYPFSPNTRGREFLQAAASLLDEAAMRKLSHENALRILRLPTP